MKEQFNTSKITFWGFAFLLLVLFETVFLRTGSIVFVIIGSFLLFLGLRKQSKFLVITGFVFYCSGSIYLMEFASFSPTLSH